MAKLYQLSLKDQARRLRRTALISLLGGGWLASALLAHGHHVWAILVTVISLQTAIGSTIMMKDVKRDIGEQERVAKLNF